MERHRRKNCYFCKEKIEIIDYQNIELLKKYLDFYNRIQPAFRTRTCAGHQRQLTTAIKKARYAALLPYM